MKRKSGCDQLFTKYTIRFSVVLTFLLLIGCRFDKVEDKMTGAELVTTHCQSCHSLPVPSLLPKKTWENDVLPQMGAFLGIYDQAYPRASYLETGLYAKKLENLFPMEAALSSEEWQKIADFYTSNAPMTLEDRNYKKDSAIEQKSSILDQFRWTPAPVTYPNPHTSLVKIFAGNDLYLFSEANPERSLLNILSTNGDLLQVFEWQYPFSYAFLDGADLVLTVIGDLNPSDKAEGQLMKLFYDSAEAKYTEYAMLLNNLQRPVHTIQHDLDQDGLQDLLVCEFGNLTGSLSWFKAIEPDRYVKKVIRDAPGAIRSVIRDFDQNGLPDIMTLFAQGDESIRIFYNQGADNFKEVIVLQFPPTYGSAWFDLVDLNQDGLEDIIYVNGDNADYDPVLKPYHGVRIFNQVPGVKFEASFFHHLDGAFKALASDFDLDGDLDLAVSSFFPDFSSKESAGFIMLENHNHQENYQFSVSSFPDHSKGRFLVMDVADLDQDGDQDIMLGAFLAFETTGDTTNLQDKWANNAQSVQVLKNLTIK